MQQKTGKASAMPPSDHGIHLTNAGLALSGRPILQGLTLALTEQRIAIVGRNGSGKSSLIRLMAGLIAPSQGQVRVDGIDPAQDRKALLPRLGILFQNPDHQILFPTVVEELSFGLIQQGLTKAQAQSRAQTLLAQHGRTHWADAAVSTLSGGQRHWLCLQSILLMAPQTILLDEPFAGLDLPAQQRLTRAFAALPQRLITVTHDPASATNAERMIWIEAGRLRADGPPAVVLPEFLATMEEEGARDVDSHLAG